MTERLYLSNPYLARFTGRITDVREANGRIAVVLDRTAFYPEGGGQPADHGTIGGVRVTDVQEVEGEVRHFLGGPVRSRVPDTGNVDPGSVARLVPGSTVGGEVDWRRRFDHMQQHHGQHLLSASFERLLSARTVSFHLGEESCTIDLDAPASGIGPADLRRVEAAANDLVWRDLPIEAREHTPDELARLPLRKDAVKGSRIVVVAACVPGAGQHDPGADPVAGPGAGQWDPAVILDASPCGGTHPRRTGEVGAVAVLRAQKWGPGTRVEFVCGGRVLRALREGADRVAAASAALRCAPAELPAAVVRAADESTARRKELEVLLAALAAAVADRLADGPAGPVASRLEAPLSTPAGLRATAQALAARGRVALLGSVDADRAHLCFARPRGPGRDLGAALRLAAAALGGKGGGAPDLAQGSGPEVAALGRVLDSARESVEDPGA